MYNSQAATYCTPAYVNEKMGQTVLPHTNEIIIPTPDGKNLVAWQTPSSHNNGPVVLLLPGRSKNLAFCTSTIRLLSQWGISSLVLGWRGFSGSSGTPSQRGLILDARTAYNVLTGRQEHTSIKPIDPQKLVIMAASLGTLPATFLCAQEGVNPQALVLIASMSSIVDVAQHHLPWLRVIHPQLAAWIVRDPWQADEVAHRVTCHVLQIHGNKDEIIPERFARALHDRFPSGKAEMHVIPGGHLPSSPEFIPCLTQFLGQRFPNHPFPRP